MKKIFMMFMVAFLLPLLSSCTGTSTDEENVKFTLASTYRVMGKIECDSCKSDDQMMIDITKPDDESYTYIGLPPFRDFGNGEFVAEADLFPGTTVRIFATIGGLIKVSKDVDVPSNSSVISVDMKVE